MLLRVTCGSMPEKVHRGMLTDRLPAFAGPFVAGALAGMLVTLATLAVMAPNSPAGKTTGRDSSAQPSRDATGKRSREQSEIASREDYSPRDAAAQLQSILSTGAMPDDMGKLNNLIDKAARFDPQAALDSAMGILDPSRRRDVMRRVLTSWITSDRDGAMAAIAAIDNLALRNDLTRHAIGTLTDSNPAGAVALLKSIPTMRDDGLWRESFANWAKADSAAAIAAWDSLKHPEQRRDALRGIASTLARKDVDSAIDWAKSLKEDKDRDSAVLSVLSSATESNPLTAARHAELLKGIDGDRARETAGHIGRRLAENDVPGAIDWAEKLAPAQKDSVLREIARDVMRYDPDAAEQMLGKIQDDRQRQQMIGDLARLHMTGDPQEAMKWIAALPAGDQSAAWRQAASEWAGTRPEDAAAHVLTGTLDDTARRYMIEATAESWSRIEPASAAQWATRLGGKEGLEALGRIVDEWSRRDPQSALGFIADSTTGGQMEDLTRRAIGRWSQEKPLEAANFAANLQQSDMKTSVVQNITDNWMHEDSMGASEWVASLEPSPARDSAVTTLINRIERDDPEAAVQWAETINDPKTRDETYKRLLRRLEQDK